MDHRNIFINCGRLEWKDGTMPRNTFLVLGIGLLLILWLPVSIGAADIGLARQGVTLTSLDSSGNVGQYTSVTVGADGLGLISYHDVANGALKIAHCSDLSCVPAATERLSMAGSHRSKKPVTGWPSVKKKKNSATAEREPLRGGNF
jgi:hypothetical protein